MVLQKHGGNPCRTKQLRLAHKVPLPLQCCELDMHGAVCLEKCDGHLALIMPRLAQAKTCNGAEASPSARLLTDNSSAERKSKHHQISDPLVQPEFVLEAPLWAALCLEMRVSSLFPCTLGRRGKREPAGTGSCHEGHEPNIRH